MIADLLAAWRHLRQSPAHVVIVTLSVRGSRFRRRRSP
jgi:hypothetical protein